MGFLAPLAFWLAAIVGPALLVLYFLKLRRRQETVSSTFLWRRAVQDLQVNAPFQRLRKSLLLFLQLLVLALGVLALARPIVETSLSERSSVVLLIDRSASMNTVEADGRTRLELAKEQAVRHVKALNRAGGSWLSFFRVGDQTRVMVIAFADRAHVVAPFTTNTPDLVRMIEEIEPSDARTNLREALELAEAYMQQTRLEQTTESTETPSQLVLFSDGHAEGLDDVVLQSEQVTLIPVGETRDNVGITNLRIQRDPERPEKLSAFVRVRNFGAEAVTSDLTLYVDGVIRGVETLTLGPDADAKTGGNALTPQASSVAITFSDEITTAAMLELRLARGDALAADNRVFAIAPPPRRMRVLLVSAGKGFFQFVLKYLPLKRWDYMTPEQYESAAEAKISADGRSVYDLVILDKHSTARLPIGNYLFIKAIPQIEGFEVTGELEDHPMIWWDETHPLLHALALEYVVAAKGLVVTMPPEAKALIEGPSGPILARYANAGRQMLLLTFAVEESNWWGLRSFPMFIQNVLSYFGGGGAESEPLAARPGDTLRIPAAPGTRELKLKKPDASQITLRADDDGVARFAGTQQVGVYQVSPGVDGRDRFAVNLSDAVESDITPQTTLTVGGASVEVGKAITTATPEIWRWFVGAALLLVLVEWIIYNRRVMI